MPTQLTPDLEERDVAVGDLNVHVLRRGTGPVVVVLHHSTGPLWGPLHDALAVGHRVVAPDLPGFGRSDRMATARHPSHLAVLLQQALDALGHPRVHLVGTGFGGWVAAEMTAANQSRVESLTLVGAAGMRPSSGLIHDPMMESWEDYVRRGFSSDAAFTAFFGDEVAPDVVDLWDRSREATARVTWKPWMWSLQLPQLLRAVTVPTVLVWGAEDRIVPVDCAEQYRRALPHAAVEIVAGAGHLIDIEHPDRVAGLVAALAAGRAPAATP